MDDAAPLALPAGALPPGWHGRVDRGAVGVLFDRPRPVLSSALVNGGWGQAGGFCNMTVDAAAPRHAGGPAALVAETAAARDLPADSVGMMTGAWMHRLRLASVREAGHTLCLLLTAGLANARRAGDPADGAELVPAGDGPLDDGPVGTINCAFGTSLALTPAACAETLATLTEAKTATLIDHGVTSPVTGAPATGTGTDATAVFAGLDGAPLAYTGKHTRFGELAARLMITALGDALAGIRGAAHAR